MKRCNVNLVFVILIISISVLSAQDDDDLTTDEYAETDDDATPADNESEEPEITTRAPIRRPVAAGANPNINNDFSGNNGGCSICAYLNTIRAPNGRGGGRYNSDYNYSYSNGRYTRRNIRRRRNGNYRNSNSRNDQRWRQSSWSRYANAAANYDDDYYYDDNSLSSNGNQGSNRNSFGNCRDGACNLRSYFNSYYNARNSDQARKSNTYQRCLWTVGNIGYF